MFVWNHISVIQDDHIAFGVLKNFVPGISDPIPTWMMQASNGYVRITARKFSNQLASIVK
jgi:hypothetical protein